MLFIQLHVVDFYGCPARTKEHYKSAGHQPAGSIGSARCKGLDSQSEALDVAPGLVAERVFGFAGAIGGEGADLDNARALGNSLLFCWLLPFFCCFLFYFGAARSSWESVKCWSMHC